MALWHEIDLTTDTDVDLVLGYSCAFHRNGKGYLSGGSGLHGPDDVEEESLFSDYEELELSDCKVSIVNGSATIIYQSGMFNMLDMDFMLRLIKKDVPSLKGAVAGSLNGEDEGAQHEQVSSHARQQQPCPGGSGDLPRRYLHRQK